MELWNTSDLRRRLSAFTHLLATGIILLPGVVLGITDPGHAETTEGVVVNVHNDEVVIDLGSEHGLTAATSVRLYRRLVVAHPITKKKLEDRFPIGELRPAQVGTVLSILRPGGTLRRQPEEGDFVVFETAPQKRDDLTVDTAEPGHMSGTPEDALLEKTFQRNLGQSLQVRIINWQNFLSTFPETPHRTVIQRELQLLHELDGRLTVAVSKDTEYDYYHQDIQEIEVDQPVELMVMTLDIDKLHGVSFYVRVAGDTRYDRLHGIRRGDIQFGVTLPTPYTTRPGQLEYFVEAHRKDGKTDTLLGSATKPSLVEISKPAFREEDRENRTSLTLRANYVDFSTVGKGDDYYYLAEATVKYRLKMAERTRSKIVIHAISFGAGQYNGEGERIDNLEAGIPSRQISASYGFAAVEVGLGDYVGARTRLSVGNRIKGQDQGSKGTNGLDGQLRFGLRDGTRLLIGGSYLSGVGRQAEAEMIIEAFEQFPLAARATVTNMPVGEQLGVQLGTSIGWQINDHVTIFTDLGWNARTIENYGILAGGGMVFSW